MLVIIFVTVISFSSWMALGSSPCECFFLSKSRTGFRGFQFHWNTCQSGNVEVIILVWIWQLSLIHPGTRCNHASPYHFFGLNSQVRLRSKVCKGLFSAEVIHLAQSHGLIFSATLRLCHWRTGALQVFTCINSINIKNSSRANAAGFPMTAWRDESRFNAEGWPGRNEELQVSAMTTIKS